MNSEQIIVDNKEYYFNSEILQDPEVVKVFLFEDPELEIISKDLNGKTLMIPKEDIRENINEWGGAGYSVYGGRGGFGNPSAGGKFYGRGFGFGQSSNSGSGGANIMYTYSVEPLNQLLQTPPTIQEQGEYIHIGSEIKGKILGKKEWLKSAKIISIEEDAENNISAYIVINPKTGQKVRIDPTSAELVDKVTTPNIVLKDIIGESFYPSFKEFLNKYEKRDL